ncbi:MAG: ferritin family protein [Syntrophomonadaceae bacterium]|jgi:rubrerythrin|nr:ferritin family protein [Syntrophomonadaceae bacterium]
MALTPYESIINMAIDYEIEAYEFYHALSQKNLEPGMKQIFDELAQEEKNHRDILTEFLRNPDKPLKFKAPAGDFKVAESVELPPLTLDMKPVDAIALAMKKEEEAMNRYLVLAQESDSAAQKGIFEELAKMEQGHKTRLEDIYTNMAFPEVW